MNDGIGKKLLGGVAGLFTVFAVGLLVLTILTTPVSADDTKVPTTMSGEATVSSTCGANGASCDGGCGGACGGACPAAKTGSCACAR